MPPRGQTRPKGLMQLPLLDLASQQDQDCLLALSNDLPHIPATSKAWSLKMHQMPQQQLPGSSRLQKKNRRPSCRAVVQSAQTRLAKKMGRHPEGRRTGRRRSESTRSLGRAQPLRRRLHIRTCLPLLGLRTLSPVMHLVTWHSQLCNHRYVVWFQLLQLLE